jgi:hypothetical protein
MLEILQGRVEVLLTLGVDLEDVLDVVVVDDVVDLLLMSENSTFLFDFRSSARPTFEDVRRVV